MCGRSTWSFWAARRIHRCRTKNLINQGGLAGLEQPFFGANDGTISVASLVVGIAASGAPPNSIPLTGIAGLVGGTVAMAASEYVSVQSQADTEDADIASERLALEHQPGRELTELTAIYVSRGLDEPLARQVAEKLMSTDALGAHSRDELGITETLRARPVQAAFASALSFAIGAMVPIATALRDGFMRLTAASTSV